MNWLDLPEQLFDLHADPTEMQDLGRDVASESTRARVRERLLDFLARRKHRTSVSDEFVANRTDTHKKAGVFFGQW